MDKKKMLCAFAAGGLGVIAFQRLANRECSSSKPLSSEPARERTTISNSTAPPVPSDKVEQRVAKILERYDIGYWNGFLRDKRIAISLPVQDDPTFVAWENLASHTETLAATGNFRSTVDKLPPLNVTKLLSYNDTDLVWRAHILLCITVQLYVFEFLKPVSSSVPANLAVPACKVAKYLGIEPIITHFSLTVRNVEKIDRNKPMMAENLSVRSGLLGGMDEKWFITATAQVEAEGAIALRAIVRLKILSVDETLKGTTILEEALQAGLTDVLSGMKGMNRSLKRMKERCDPDIFFNRLRPVLAGWGDQGLVFEGVSNSKSHLSGASAAQSALFSVLDVAFGVEHGGSGGKFLQEMRSYMPAIAREFIAYVGNESQGKTLQSLAVRSDNPSVKDTYNQCVAELSKFRKIHLGIVSRYIIQPSKRAAGMAVSNTPLTVDEEDLVPENSGEGVKGTGGTDVLEFLKPVMHETQHAKLA